ncbi:ABC transporter permease subunit [Dactylosporangium sp. AC04546]|nr:ABC transporter permease subunit [Dactylosporangium sp. AC04546]WVK89610.1 ABC transporter permease subunit [Dactylosporangium sp. AC04546]
MEVTERRIRAGTVAGRAVRAEWTKLRSVRGTWLALAAMAGLTLFLGLLSGTLSRSDVNLGVLTVDQFHFVHRPLAGDGTITARVTAQADSGAWAKAGLMLKASDTSGAPYVALMVTPDHGVLLQADARAELRGRAGGAPRWLRLTRAGQSVTGAESADGVSWRDVGTVTVPGLPAEARAGVFVGSPPYVHFTQLPHGKYKKYEPTIGEARFDHVEVSPGGGGGAWRDTDVTPADPQDPPPPFDHGLPNLPILPGASAWQDDGSVTVRGSGDIGRAGLGGIDVADMDRVKESLFGVQLGIIGAIALGALAMTSEYRSRTLATTFAMQPGRSLVLGAKTAVLALVVFAAGLATGVVSFLVTQPMQERRGYGPPAYPSHSLTDPVVLRAIGGAAAYLALIAVFSLAVGTIVRRTAGAVTTLLTVLVVVPVVVAGTSEAGDGWLRRFTPVAGTSILQTTQFAPGSNDTVTGPWTGFAVLCGYTAVALGVAFWLLRRRDP